MILKVAADNTCAADGTQEARTAVVRHSLNSAKSAWGLSNGAVSKPLLHSPPKAA
jgi:hypothetical protein